MIIAPPPLPSFASSGYRGSQAARLADELRGTASGQTSASSALADAGVLLVTDASAERPPPRDYTAGPPDRHTIREFEGQASDRNIGAFKGSASDGMTTQGLQRSVNNISDPLTKSRIIDDLSPTTSEKCTGTVQAGGSAGKPAMINNTTSSMQHGGLEARPLGTRGGVFAADDDSDFSAIEVAAKREELTASARISSFLCRRRQENLVGNNVSGTNHAVPTAAAASSSGSVGWLGAAVLALRQAIDTFLLAEKTKHPKNLADNEMNPNHNAGAVASGEVNRTTDQASHGSFVSRATTNRSKLDGSNDDGKASDGDSLTTLSKVPLRARVPSLYTLPPPGGSWGGARAGGGGGADGVGCTSNNTSSGIFTKLDPEVAARLYSARSVFALRASDVLAIFSPPPPPPLDDFTLSARGDLSSRPSTAPPAVGHGVPAAAMFGHGRSNRRKSSSEALRQRLRAEAAEAFHTGLGRPWGLPKWPSGATHHRLKKWPKFHREVPSPCTEGNVEGGGYYAEEQSQYKKKPSLAGPFTALGRRLLAKRESIARASRRRSMMGEMDAVRARHACKQSGNGAALGALESVGRVLDVRLTVAREKKMPLEGIETLVDALDGFIFSDSQVRLRHTLWKELHTHVFLRLLIWQALFSPKPDSGKKMKNRQPHKSYEKRFTFGALFCKWLGRSLALECQPVSLLRYFFRRACLIFAK